MKELRLSVSYPMPLNLALDREIKTYSENFGFKFLGSGSDGYSRDIEFQGSIGQLENSSLLLLLRHLMRVPTTVRLYCLEPSSPSEPKEL